MLDQHLIKVQPLAVGLLQNVARPPLGGNDEHIHRLHLQGRDGADLLPHPGHVAAHLARIGLRWESVEQDDRRWLLLHDYPLPLGYSVTHSLLALEVPPTYPGAQIYGFYAFPPLALASGGTIENPQLRGTIDGREFHGWSRNRGSLAWNPATDNVATQLMLVDAALAKAVGE